MPEGARGAISVLSRNVRTRFPVGEVLAGTELRVAVADESRTRSGVGTIIVPNCVSNERTFDTRIPVTRSPFFRKAEYCPLPAGSSRLICDSGIVTVPNDVFSVADQPLAG